MTLSLKLLLTMKSAILALFVLTTNKPSYYVYLNNPETVTSTGILHKKTFEKNSHVRYFFHYLNGTDKSQQFSIKNKEIVTNFKKSINTDERPEFAGALTVKNFLKAETQNCKINITSNVNPEETISGILEGDFQKGDSITYKFGNNDLDLSSFDIYQSEYNFDIPINIGFDSAVQFKLGGGIENTVKGQYGSNINIVVNPKETGILKMTFSPRGGAGLLVFSNRGKIFITKLMPAFKKYDAFMISVEKGKKETFTFIPCGGLNYPINLDFSLQQFELNPDIA
jgi:hypothetical protein